MQRKMYTAFVSSVSSLKEERRATLDVLLDLDVFPVATEHFVIQSKDGINDIERLIDDSDFFILLMGSEYGPKNKIGEFTGSWTEYELVYALEHARSNNTKIIIIELPELKRISSLSSSEKETLKTSEKNQLGFLDRFNGNTICQVTDISSLRSTLSTFIEGNRRANSASGWVRALSAQGCFGIEFGRTYRQVHLSPNDDTYIRVGTAFLAAVSSRLRWFMSMESTIRRVLTLAEILSLATEGARRNGKANTLAKTEGCAVSMRHIDGTTERLAVNL